jgi:hypothetical protein
VARLLGWGPRTALLAVGSMPMVILRRMRRPEWTETDGGTKGSEFVLAV